MMLSKSSLCSSHLERWKTEHMWCEESERHLHSRIRLFSPHLLVSFRAKLTENLAVSIVFHRALNSFTRICLVSENKHLRYKFFFKFVMAMDQCRKKFWDAFLHRLKCCFRLHFISQSSNRSSEPDKVMVSSLCDSLYHSTSTSKLTISRTQWYQTGQLKRSVAEEQRYSAILVISRQPKYPAID